MSRITEEDRIEEIRFKNREIWEMIARPDFGDDDIANVLNGRQKEQANVMKQSVAELNKYRCPLCGYEPEWSYYLYKVFKNDIYSQVAANLVTHYRHVHIKYYDRAWQSKAYRKKIPMYDYDGQKELVNNRAKRQMIRALVKKKPENWREIIRGFRNLKYNDAKTQELLQSMILK